MALTENDVVRAVAAHLRGNGYRIDRAVSTNEPGIDVTGVHEQTRRKIYIEAKGNTSSKVHTNQYGKPFTSNQAKSHVSVAFYWAARMYETAMQDNADVALAFPDNATHRKLVGLIKRALQSLGIAVYFVADDSSVTVFDDSTSTQ